MPGAFPEERLGSIIAGPLLHLKWLRERQLEGSSLLSLMVKLPECASGWLEVQLLSMKVKINLN